MTNRSQTLDSMRVGVLQFPGSNCDADCLDTLTRHFKLKPVTVWHTEAKLPKLDAVVIPGGFSFGDYLRSGALASHSPIMADVKEFAARGGAIMGICNGFQILVESQILPGMLLHNESLKFICRDVYLKSNTGATMRMPIAHGEGRYYASSDVLAGLKKSDLIAYRYCDANGEITAGANPNGALQNIAGIYSSNKRVLGMMPHPERATDKVMGGSDDGLVIWREFLERV